LTYKFLHKQGLATAKIHLGSIGLSHNQVQGDGGTKNVVVMKEAFDALKGGQEKFAWQVACNYTQLHIVHASTCKSAKLKY